MARGRKVILAASAALAAVCHFRRSAFVPSAARRGAVVVAPAAAAAVASAPAFADEIGDAAKTLSEAAYPFMKEVDWNTYAYLLKPGEASAADWAKAIDSAIVMGAQMDPELLKKGVLAHHKAIGSISEANPVLSKGDFEAVNAAIGRMIASVPESSTMDVYNSFSKLVSADVPPYMMSKVNEADAKKAYEAWLQFKDVVKAHPITAQVADTPAAMLNKMRPIEDAAAKLSSASYPFIKDVDWTSDVFLKPLPGVTANQALKAVDKMLVMGASMDGKLLKEAAEAHHKALVGMDSKLVATPADYEAVNAGLGKIIASVPASQVMDVYNAMAKILNPSVPSNMFNSVNANDAQAAYSALMSFKDVVKAAQM